VTAPEVRFSPFGESAVLVTLGDRIDVDLNRRAHLVASAVGRLRIDDPRLGRPVTGYASILVPFDPLELDAAAVQVILAPSIEAALVVDLEVDLEADPATDASPPGRPRLVTIAARYGGADGPDLDEVAMLHDLRPADVVALHAGTTYRVFMLGFAPGFAYLGPLPAELFTPRRATPRERVPAGSVAIAGGQTAVYPFETPGGWQLVGRTERRLWDLRHRSPALLQPGDAVRFEPLR
jgi:KipI family sensor histidine kinase inhibitor